MPPVPPRRADRPIAPRSLAIAALAGVVGCAPAPEVDVARFDVTPPPEGYPALLPIEAVLAADPPRAGAPVAAPARAQALRTRARALAGPVIAPPERARLDAARAAERQGDEA